MLHLNLPRRSHTLNLLKSRCQISNTATESLLTEQYQHDTLDSGTAHAPFSLLKYQSELKMYPALKHPFPAYRILMPDGSICRTFLAKKKQTALMKDHDLVKRIYLTMLTQQSMDKILYDAQRQGRISFYLTGAGEEAAVIASAAALQPQDFIYAQYREPGALLFRGYPLSKMMNQVFSNRLDDGKGRQMPVHYGSKEHNYMTISSPLATQIPQAAGAAYALKRENEHRSFEKKRLVACYFGDGSASEGDFHAALNFAATLECPTVFLCRNNGYAISTPVAEQYAGDGIAARGPAYGVRTYRVDGNDIFAVHDCITEARDFSINSNKPTLIELMTYRLGHHSTSDDSTVYREKTEVDAWVEKYSGFHRLKQYLLANQIMTSEEINLAKSSIDASIMKEFARAEKEIKPSIRHMFNDVYDQQTPFLKLQERELHNLMKEYPADFASASETKFEN